MNRRTGPAEGRELGQILVIFAGGLITLLLAVGLVIDGGFAFVNRRDGQNVSDLASMAGTKMIADHYLKGGRTGLQVFNAIDASATRNGCTPTAPTPCSWTARYVRPITGAEEDLGPVVDSGSIASGAQGVKVDIRRLPRTFFLGLMGQANWQVDTTATALVATQPGLPAGQVLPIAANPPGNYVPGGTYEFSVDRDGPGNFGWLSWNGSNDAPTLAESLCNPNNPEITFPAWVDGDPGASNANAVRDCVDYWIAHGTTVLIPIWGPGCPGDPGADGTEGVGSHFEYCVIGMAAFVLTAHGQPAIDSITGRFVEYFPLPTVPAGYGTAPSVGDEAVFIGLVR